MEALLAAQGRSPRRCERPTNWRRCGRGPSRRPAERARSRRCARRSATASCATGGGWAAGSTRLARRGGAVDPRELAAARGAGRGVGRRAWRRAARRCPSIRYDESLPVHARRAEIAAAIARSPVTIVSGATGSGKSTQLPKICLELGRGVAGMIGHTQPRRIAAQTLAYRVSAELGTTPGDLVGYQVRFVDRTEPAHAGQADDRRAAAARTRGRPAARALRHADPRRGPRAQPERRLPARRLPAPGRAPSRAARDRHLGDHRDAPLRGVLRRRARSSTSRAAAFRSRCATGRSSEEETEAPSLPEAIADRARRTARQRRRASTATRWCSCRASGRSPRRATTWNARAAATGTCSRSTRGCRPPEQERVFEPHPRRRAVLATNVAETSLTIPGVRFVVDAGLARISRYSPRAKFQRLPIEPVSRASAEQRKGRCGRVGEGICIRLYSEEDFAARAGVHRSGDPAHQPREPDPADGGARARRARGFPVPRRARHAAAERRLPPAAGAERGGRRPAHHAARPADGRAAGRPAPRAHPARGGPAALPGRGAGDRGVPQHPGSARAAGRQDRGRGRGARACSRTSAPTSSPC